MLTLEQRIRQHIKQKLFNFKVAIWSSCGRFGSAAGGLKFNYRAGQIEHLSKASKNAALAAGPMRLRFDFKTIQFFSFAFRKTLRNGKLKSGRRVYSLSQSDDIIAQLLQ